ncbi:BrnA antitoxin family protein [Castellaniella hirudinis]|uniref:BrnA antitoxin family protein n=1 Tax=Castellaniella hirudinis TaxID=1144617 RepID=UPI0039C1102B
MTRRSARVACKQDYRGPQKEPTKERITIRLSASTLADFRATGPGWQGRIDSALRDWLDAHQRK